MAFVAPLFRVPYTFTMFWNWFKLQLSLF